MYRTVVKYFGPQATSKLKKESVKICARGVVLHEHKANSSVFERNCSVYRIRDKCFMVEHENWLQ